MLMPTLIQLYVFLAALLVSVEAFRSPLIRTGRLVPVKGFPVHLVSSWMSSFPLAETTVSEEEILDIVGAASELPDPQLTISFAVAVVIGTAILQFSLGDLTKEEGQARVRDFLATKRETERKRGYFD
jgi:hypothetical protein